MVQSRGWLVTLCELICASLSSGGLVSTVFRIFVKPGSEYKWFANATTKISAKLCLCFLIRTIKHCKIDLSSISLGIRDENDDAGLDRSRSDVWHHPPLNLPQHTDILDIHVLSTLASLGQVVKVPPDREQKK